MSTREEPANIGKVLSFLREWDRGDRKVRSRMLSAFVAANTGKTFCELELEFAQVASLFLARLSTWMRLTYMFGSDLGLQLKAIGVFLSASTHDQYLMEFVEDGGVLTLLDILGHSQSKEAHKAEALRLLLTVSHGGRKYKEIICECHGVKVIAECLALSYETQETARALLESLSNGNPKHLNQMYRSFIALLACSSPKAQHLLLHVLHTVQLRLKTAHECIVEPLLSLLQSLHLEVQNEAIRLILDLRCFDVKEMLLTGLVALLRPNKDEVQQHEVTEEFMEMTGSLPVFVQQAAAAKTIRLLAEEDQELCRELVSLGVIQQLMCAMGNRAHVEAQIQASLALQHFVRTFPVLEEHVQKVMGKTMFAAFTSKADAVHLNMDDTQAHALLSNQINTQVLEVWKAHIFSI